MAQVRRAGGAELTRAGARDPGVDRRGRERGETTRLGADAGQVHRHRLLAGTRRGCAGVVQAGGAFCSRGGERMEGR